MVHDTKIMIWYNDQQTLLLANILSAPQPMSNANFFINVLSLSPWKKSKVECKIHSTTKKEE